MSCRVSFIVPVRNDAARLDLCLRSIRRNGQARDQIEIIVVDNGSVDESAAVARRHGARVLVVGQGSVARLRNEGARQASGEMLAFVDADNEIADGWVEAAVDCLQMPEVGAAGALYEAPPDGTWVQRAYGYLRGTPRDRREVIWLGSGNLAVIRAAFERLGGFDTSLDTCEDVDFCHRLRTHGLRVISDARLKSIHHGDPRTLGEVLTSERWRGRDNLRVTFRRPISWASVPSAIVPLVQTMFIGLAAIGLIVAASNIPVGASLMLAALAGFGAATALRVVRALMRGRDRGVGLAPAFVVAAVLDIGRALALLSKAPHRGARPGTAAAASS